MNTETGLRAIETVQVGDRVWAYDLVAGQWSLQSVLKTFVRDYRHDAVVITVDDDEITSTQLHPFWVIDGEELIRRPVREHLYAPPENSRLTGRWVDAIDLRPGDTVFLQSAGPTRIESVRTAPADYPVYNFAVDGLKCYTVGRGSVLVHNPNGIEVPKLKPIHAPDDDVLTFWRTKPTEEILESLKPGSPESLKAWTDGRIMNEHHRLKILEERGIDIHFPPRDIHDSLKALGLPPGID